MKDTYRSIPKPSEEVLFKEKNSKFFGYAFPVTNEEQVKTHLEDLKKQHHSARHWCYAYQIGVLEQDHVFRANDDGEPNNSAGAPIYGQIQSFEVTNILIVVVRYFGGVKLGVGGLITAYKTAAQMSLENSDIQTYIITQPIHVTFDYKNMNKVMRVIKEKQLDISEQKLELNCQITLAVRLKDVENIFEIFNNLYEIDVKLLEA